MKKIDLPRWSVKKNNSYDVFFILVLLSLLFSIGYGIERGTPEVEKAYVTVSVRITELKGTPSEDNSYFLDGKYEIKISEIYPDRIVFSMDSIVTEAGVLVFGAKYISENQPIKITSDQFYLEGRIAEMTLFR